MEEKIVSKPVRKQRDIFDLTKYVLCFIVIMVHSSFLREYLYPWTRIIVPIYFMISAFLFCEKLNRTPEAEHWKVTKKYIWRNVTLYLFWFIVLSPITFIFRKGVWSGENSLLSITKVLETLFLTNSFFSSWFITGCIYGALAIFLTRKVPTWILATIICVAFTIFCFFSSYSFVFGRVNEFATFYAPNAIVWMLLGALVVRHNIEIKSKKGFIIVGSLTALTLGLLFVEWYFVRRTTGVFTWDTLFFVLPLSFLTFVLIKDIPVKVKHAKTMRKLSTTLYTTHFSLIAVFNFILEKICPDLNAYLYTFILFAASAIVAHLISYLIFYLEKKPHLSFLRYSY